MLKLRGLNIEWPVWLAPMAGVTDSPYRLLNRELGCPLVVTEMVSAEGLLRRQQGSLQLLRFQPAERPLFAQLFGSRPPALAEAARLCTELGFDGIDINMGCPVRKVVGTGAGAALLREPRRALQMVAAVRRASELPLTVKLRAGWSPAERNAVELGRALAGEGADALILHPRTRDQFYAGRADWRLVAELAAAVSVPVIGNGDLRRPADADEHLRRFGCAGVMVGRAALGDPWLCGAMARRLAGRATGYPPPAGERYRVFCNHLQNMIDYLGSPERAVRRMRKNLVWYTRGLSGAGRLRRRLGELESAEQMRQAFAHLLRMQRDGEA